MRVGPPVDEVQETESAERTWPPIVAPPPTVTPSLCACEPFSNADKEAGACGTPQARNELEVAAGEVPATFVAGAVQVEVER